MTKKNSSLSIQQLKTIGRRLLANTRESAEKYINALPQNQQLQLFLTTEPKHRLRILSLFPNPRKFVRHISEEELYWTIKEAGIKRTFPLFKYSSPAQLQFIFDLEWWNTDQLELKRIAQWLNILSRSGSKKIIQWFKTFDFELLILTLQKFVTVYKPHEGTDDYGESIDGLPDFTLDGVYFCFFPHKGTEETMQKLIRILIAHDTHFYSMILENIIWGQETELEYNTYQSTQRRLADKGIPEEDEALAIYRFIPDNDIESLPKKDISSSKRTASSLKSFYPIRLSTDNELYIRTVLEQISDPVFLEEFSVSIAHLANKILVADQFSFSDHSSFKNKVLKAIGIANIGLETLLERNNTTGEEILRSYWLEHLFSVGWSKISILKNTYKKQLDTLYHSDNNRFLNFDSPIHEILVGFFKGKPLFFAEDTASAHYRDFQSLAELNKTEESIQYALFIHHLLDERLGLRFPDYSESSSILDDSTNKTYTASFLTGYANKTMNGEWTLKPLSFNSVKLFLNTLFPSDFPDSDYSLEQISSAAENVCKESLESSNDVFLKRFVTSCFTQLEKEYLEAVQNHFLDIILFKSLWIQHYYSA